MKKTKKSVNKDSQNKIQKQIPKITYPEILPIVEYKDEIIRTIKENQVVIIEGETGSGKTTQIPKMCIEGGRGLTGKIGCTQPRRVATISIAKRISEELNSTPGDLVGYKIRFLEKNSPNTILQIMTDGVLLAETQKDPNLKKYDTLIIDEAHERSLNIDFLLGYIKRLLFKRPELKLVITSASIDTEKFSKAFNSAPIIEVSGRTYPVRIKYDPIDEEKQQKADFSINDKAVEVVQDLIDNTWSGDILVFMPGEADIREVIDRLNPSKKQYIEFLPLFGRLSIDEQSRIFQHKPFRKVIISTNIAETSLTIPGIKYVVDSGLARTSRYSRRSQIQHLPIEQISKSSALQRSGRAGRVEAGVCIRLYEEEKFKNSQLYTDPEILRSNLGGVILQMLSLKLGKIENFPFLDPPGSLAIKQGFTSLSELDAVNNKKEITPLGREMASLPIEPKTARMLLEANKNKVLKEVLIIAAGLSIRDPREFPLEKEEQARQIHKVFFNKDSDFITLLNIWNKYHEKLGELKTQNKVRKFCKKNFLSYVRMREWNDIHNQLIQILKKSKKFILNSVPGEYKAIHLSILAGYLNHIAKKKENSSNYQSAMGKEVVIFPGSGLLKKGKNWIVAAEYIKTRRLYAHCVANIEPDWLEQIGGKLCRYNYSNPYYNEKSERVLVSERVTLYGLTIIPERKTAYGKINPSDATAIFIREALIEEKLKGVYSFFENNNALKHSLIEKGAKIRRNFDFQIESAMETFYKKHLYNIFSIHDLNGLLKKKQTIGEKFFLYMSENDFTDLETDNLSKDEFPDFWDIGDKRLKINYNFDLQSKNDGVTIQLNDNILPYIDYKTIDWLIPGHRAEKILYLLKGLPKSIRKQVIPLPQTSRLLAEKMKPNEKSFFQTISSLFKETYNIQIPSEEWDRSRIPEHLNIKIEIIDHNNKIVSSGRDIKKLIEDRKKRSNFKKEIQKNSEKPKVWQDAELKWNLEDLETWSFNELPEKIEIAMFNDIPLYGYPGLELKNLHINRRIFSTRNEAISNTAPAVSHLIGKAISSEIGWLEKNLKELNDIKKKYGVIGYYTFTELKNQTKEALFSYIFDGPWISLKEDFQKRVDLAKKKSKGLWTEAKFNLTAILEEYKTIWSIIKKHETAYGNTESFKDIKNHLSSLINRDFIKKTPYSQWKHLPRYLKAAKIRLERMDFHIQKDQNKLNQLLPLIKQFNDLARINTTNGKLESMNKLRWLIEEYRVSLFAPELKTACPVSEKRIEKFITEHF